VVAGGVIVARSHVIVAEVRVDVSDAVGTGEHLEVVARVMLPQDSSGPRTAIFGYPGGGYNRHYYDLHIPGHDGYSQAQFHVDRGQVFVACDHLAVGDSDVPTRSIDYPDVARANMHAAREIRRRLEAGELAAGIPPVELSGVAALGQSFGGFLLILGQGAEPAFDGIAILGYSASHTRTPWPDNLTLEDVRALRGGNGLQHPMTRWFHYDDVPVDIVEADMTKELGTLGSKAAWSTSMNPGGTAIRPVRNPRDAGAVASEAARIGVPVLVGCGEIDVVPEPRAEPAAYPAAPHITTIVVPQMAHMHNFASTRRVLWDAITDWLPAVVRRAQAD
jgi:pimeloyl-ACP methyl ester carboxylesterase